MADENQKTKIRELARNLVLYGIIGCLAASIDALVFFLLTEFGGINPLYANAGSVLIGITTSFLLNRRFNFKVTDHPLKRGLIFLSVGLFGLCISQLILWIGLQAGYQTMMVKLFSIVVVALIQFVLNRLLSFGIKFSNDNRNA